MFELDPTRRDELVETWARRVVDRRLATPAIFLLEAHKPLAGFGAHALLAFEPLLAPMVRVNVGEVAAFIRDVGNVERLLLRIEELEQQRAAVEQERRQRSAEARRRARRIRRLRRTRHSRRQ